MPPHRGGEALYAFYPQSQNTPNTLGPTQLNANLDWINVVLLHLVQFPTKV